AAMLRKIGEVFDELWPTQVRVVTDEVRLDVTDEVRGRDVTDENRGTKKKTDEDGGKAADAALSRQEELDDWIAESHAGELGDWVTEYVEVANGQAEEAIERMDFYDEEVAQAPLFFFVRLVKSHPAVTATGPARAFRAVSKPMRGRWGELGVD